MGVTLGARFVAYDPAGAKRGILPYPLAGAARDVFNDIGGGSIDYLADAQHSPLLEGLCEIAAEVNDGRGWTELGARMLRLKRGGSVIEETRTRRYTLHSYGIQLSKMRMLREETLDENGDRIIASATAGAVIKTLFDETKARGNATTFLYDFTAAADSNGKPWGSTLPPITLRFGDDLLSLLRMLADNGACDWKIQGRTLRMFKPDTLGTNKAPTIQLFNGVDVVEAPDDEDATEMAGRIGVIGDEGRTYEAISPTVNPWGLWEESVNASGVKDIGGLQFIGEAEQRRRSAPRVQMTRKVRTVDVRHLPILDYGVGDTITVPNQSGTPEAVRVRELQLDLGSEGVSVNATLNDLILERDISDRRNWQGMLGGASSSSGGSGTPTVDDKRAPAVPTGFVCSSAHLWSPTGEPFALLDAAFVPVSKGVDGRALIVRKHELYGRRDATGQVWRKITDVPSGVARITFSPMPVGEDWQFKLRAISDAGVLGEFTAPVSLKLAADTTAPDRPEAPEATTRLGQIIVTWKGRTATGDPQPIDWAHTDVLMATAPAGAGVVVGQISPSGTFVAPEQPYNEPRWFGLVSVDSSGNRSEESARATVTTKPAVSTDLDQVISDKINQASSDASDAKGAASAAATAAATAQTKADTAKTAADAAQANADALKARGTDLITNGNATQGRLNFSQFVLEVGDQPPGTAGAFWAGTSASVTRFLDEFFPVDTSKPVLASVWAREATPGVTSRFYLGVAPVDIDGNVIAPTNYMEQAGTRTTLAAPLVAGQTTMRLTSAVNWNNAAGANNHLRNVIFWNWVDGKGKLWEPGTYSRNVRSNAYADGGITGNTVTLSAPHSGATIPAGTPVSNGSAGGSFMYVPGIVNALASATWHQFVATAPFGGVHTNNLMAATTAWPVATTQARALVLSAYTSSGGDSKQLYAGFSMSEANAAQLRASEAKAAADAAAAAAAAAQTAAGNAQTTANQAQESASGKSKTYRATTVPSGVGTAAEDTWEQWSSLAVGGKLLAFWRWSGSSWVKGTVDESYLPLVNIGAGTYGALNGDRLTGRTVAAEKLLVTDFQNYFNDPTFANPIGYSPWTAGGGAIEKDGTGTQHGVYPGFTQFSVSPGERYRFAATRENLAGSTGEAMIAVQRRTPAGVYVTAVVALNLPGSGTFSAELTVPAGDGLWTVGIFTQANMPVGTRVRLRDLQIRRMTAGELIVDGAVTASKVAANAVTADKIDAGAVTAVKVAANAITGEKISADAIDGKTITGALIRSAAIGERTEMSPSGFRAVNAAGQDLVRIGYGVPTGMEVRNPYSGALVPLANAAFGMTSVARSDTLAFTFSYNNQGYQSGFTRHAADTCILTFTAVSTAYIIDFAQVWAIGLAANGPTFKPSVGIMLNGVGLLAAGVRFTATTPDNGISAWNTEGFRRVAQARGALRIDTTPGVAYDVRMDFSSFGVGNSSSTVNGTSSLRDRFIIATPVFS